MRTWEAYGYWDEKCHDWSFIDVSPRSSRDEPVTIIDTDSFTKLLKQNERLKRKVKQLEANAKGGCGVSDVGASVTG